MKRVIEERMNDLEKWLQAEIEDYIEDKKTRAAIERTVQIIIQAIIDICIQLVKFFNLEIPNSEMDLIKILQPYLKKIEILRELKKFRNFLVHVYGKINDFKVFEYTQNVLDDVPKLVAEFKGIIKQEHPNRSEISNNI